MTVDGGGDRGGTIFVHIGTMKSATTYLQHFCDLNSDKLAERGLMWPGSTLCFAATADLLGAERQQRPADGDWPSLRALVAGRTQNALISNELLSLRRPSRVKAFVEALPPGELEVVVTARDLARVAVSQWQERARHRPMPSWEDFMAALVKDEAAFDPLLRWFFRRQDLAGILETWTSVVDASRITLVTVPPPGSPPDLVRRRFLSVLGIADDALFAEPTELNPSLGAWSVEFMRRLQAALSEEQRERCRPALKALVGREILAARSSSEPALALTPDQLAWSVRRAEQMTERVAASGVKVVGELGDLVPRHPSVSRASSPVTDEDLLQVALEAVVGLVSEVQRCWDLPGGGG